MGSSRVGLRLPLRSRFRSQAQMTPSRPPEYLEKVRQAVKILETRSIQERAIGVYGQAIDAQPVSASRVGQREDCAREVSDSSSRVEPGAYHS